MIKGIGLDILEIARFESLYLKWGTKLTNKLFNKDEVVSAKSQKRFIETLSGKFAAKEAISKALGTGIGSFVSFKDIKIIKNNVGKPIVIYRGKESKVIHLSISHSNNYAAAFAVIEE